MRIQLICPAAAGTLHGNRVTALRWAKLLQALGHRVRVVQQYQGEGCDLLIALHARRSAGAVLRFHRHFPRRPVIVALTGTDLYRDLRRQRRPWRVLKLATRLIVLQPQALRGLPPALRRKARVLYQSADRTPPPPRGGGKRKKSRRVEFFDVCVIGHLRKVKDPFRAGVASRRLPASSRIRVLHAGVPMEEGMAQRARAEEKRNLRYHWLGGLSPAKTRQLMAASRLLVLSSHLEGGANVISEAVVDAVPVLASRIPGSVGLLGPGYPGYFPVGDARTLARLLLRAETDHRFYGRLKSWCSRRAGLFRPSQERARWRKLLEELRQRSD